MVMDKEGFVEGKKEAVNTRMGRKRTNGVTRSGIKTDEKKKNEKK